MCVVIDAPAWYYSKHNTDIALRYKLRDGLCEHKPVIPRGFVWNSLFNIDRIAVRAFQRLGFWNAADAVSRAFARVRGLILRFRYPSGIVICQGVNPIVSRGLKVIWETYFLNETSLGGADPTFVRGGRNRWVCQMERYGGAVSVIAVRGKKSVSLVKELFPEFSNKVVDLGFIKPEYESVAEPYVVAKQKKDGPVHILFVGREAKRKGLDVVLRALGALREKGECNFRLTIVSNMLNSEDIVIPDVDWITHHRDLSHEEVLGLMKKAQIFIMPSRFESYGLVYQEAMAYGCVVFVRDGEPQREFVDYGAAGFCVRHDDAADAEKKLCLAIQDGELRSRLAVNALRRYHENYSQAVIHAQWETAISLASRA